tara:strand:+ start:67 stop:492 length:426 start_codon:yes stop_codon:yes gene_type:complete
MIDRFTDFSSEFNINNYNESSIIGRLLSMIAGIKVLINNLFLVSFNSSSLVELTNYYGYPTFPHSHFLVILIFSPLIGIIILINFIKLFFKTFSPFYFYILISFIFYGGIIYNYKIFTLILILLKIGNEIYQNKKKIFNFN